MTYEMIRNIILVSCWILSLYLILLFDGIRLSFKNIKLFSNRYEALDTWDKLSYNVYTITKISLFVVIVFSILFIINNPEMIKYFKGVL